MSSGKIGEHNVRGKIERWFERLPMYLLEEPKRKKVVQALAKALQLEETGKLKS
jgi:hypothetical protein